MPTVTVVDYGIGNLLSVARAFDRCGAGVEVTADPGKIAGADYLVLPGVGAFADAMAALRSLGLVESIKGFVSKERPFLGICLGMQLMMEQSEEFGPCHGLGIVAGDVVAIPGRAPGGTPHKIPHIGWNGIYPAAASWEETIFARTLPGSSFYFVHSFAARPQKEEECLARCHYNGVPIAAAIRKGNSYGCQFHPEKSGPAGLALIESFLGCRR